MFAITLLLGDKAKWSGQDFGLAPFPHTLRAAEPGRAASCFWPLLRALRLGGALVPVLVALLFPELCRRKTPLTYCRLCCRSCGEGYGAVKSWRRRVMMNARVLKTSSGADSCLTVTVWWQELTICSNSITFWRYLCILGSPPTVHLTWEGDSTFAKKREIEIWCKIPNRF